MCLKPLIVNVLFVCVPFLHLRAAIAAVDILMENHFVLRDNDKSKLPVEAQSSSSSSCKTTTGKSVFVIGRPPGHHAGPNGCVPSVTYWKAPGMTSSGFCLLNTVAVAAVSIFCSGN